VPWNGRRYDRDNPDKTDLANQAINHVVTAVEATAMVAVAVAGAIPSLGFIHEDAGRAFVLDITDLHRDASTLPIAYAAVREAVAKRGLEIERLARRHAAKHLRRERLVAKMIDQVKALIDGSDDPL
jgi:CRISPR-associated protein Cas1